MPEAVIVATARSPIGRAFKGSLVDIRPDDLAAQMVRAALAQVPMLPVSDIEDLMLGCVPSPCPVLICPTEAKWHIAFCVEQHVIQWVVKQARA